MRAPICQRTDLAFCDPRRTDRPAVEHHAVAEIVGLLRRQNLAQLLFYFGGILCPVRKAQTSGNTDAVGVGHDYARSLEDIALDQVGGFAANAGQLEQIFHFRGHLAAVIPEQHLSAAHQIPAFAVEEAAGVDVFGDLGRIGLGKGLQCGKALELPC